MPLQAETNDREAQGSVEAQQQDFTKALLNILDDFGNERTKLGDTQRAVLNILEDAANEEIHLEETQKAVLNILADSVEEKAHLADTQRAVLNILDDFNLEEKKVKQRTVELESTNQELDRFAYSVSHDLKAPLRGIGQVVDWIYEDFIDKSNDEQKENMKLMKARVGRMNDLIDGLLRYARVGRVQEMRTRVKLQQLVSDVIDSLQPPKTIEIVVEGEFPTLFCVNVQIEQVFQNLIGNAIRYMDKKMGRIRVGCYSNDLAWVFSVEDTGPGIAKEHFERIFQIFQTLKPRDEVESTGIGLSIVKKVVELHNGRIWVESEVGKGSTFFFTLPKG
jgi:light-regulated signal transduction histidine kinase (bacteriophytochrome)